MDGYLINVTTRLASGEQSTRQVADLGSTARTWTHAGAVAGIWSLYSIRGHKNGDEGRAAHTDWVRILRTDEPDSPSNLRLSQQADPTEVRLNWTAGSDATGYKIYRRSILRWNDVTREYEIHKGVELQVGNVTAYSDGDAVSLYQGTTHGDDNNPDTGQYIEGVLPGFTYQSGTLTFTAGERSKTVTVAIIDDSTEESDETLTLTLSNPSGAEISDGQATGTITDSEPVPLTVSFSNVPDSHDGSTEFTFDLTFSENFELSYVTLRDHAFIKDAQNEDHIVVAQRKVQGSNQTWTITVKPPNNSTVTITLPATTDCTVSGATCTGDGRKLSNSNSVSISGPS